MGGVATDIARYVIGKGERSTKGESCLKKQGESLTKESSSGRMEGLVDLDLPAKDILTPLAPRWLPYIPKLRATADQKKKKREVIERW